MSENWVAAQGNDLEEAINPEAWPVLLEVPDGTAGLLPRRPVCWRKGHDNAQRRLVGASRKVSLRNYQKARARHVLVRSKKGFAGQNVKVLSFITPNIRGVHRERSRKVQREKENSSTSHRKAKGQPLK